MNFLSQYWQLVKPFWVSKQRLPSVGLLLIIISMTFGSVWLSVQFNQWNGDFYNALQQLDGSTIYRLLGQFCLLIGSLILVSVYSSYLQKQLLIDWRTWMTSQLTAKWLSDDHHHLHMKLAQTEPDNPDQRIAEDIYLLIDLSLDLLLSFLRSVLTLGSFLTILWNLSGEMSFNWLGEQWDIPGYMVWMCIAYTLVGTAITHWIGKPLQRLNFNQQKREADFRSALIERRENSEMIGAQNGESIERSVLGDKFSCVAKNWYKLMVKERNLGFFTVGYAQVSSLAPIFFALPQFLSGVIQLGGLMQIKMAFMQVSGSLSWFIYSYRDLAKLSATVERLTTFTQKLADIEPPNAAEKPMSPNALSANIRVLLSEDQPLLAIENLSVAQGQLVMLKGRSGLGKSSLLRALSGFWPHYIGEYQRSDSIWIPQKLYLTTTSIKALICYPKSAENIDDLACTQALLQVGLTSLTDQLDRIESWSTQLSGGEQQRLMFARLLINKPELILLDETTSSLDQTAASDMVRTLKQSLPDSAILMVTHQSQLWSLADTLIDLDHTSPVTTGA
ncbi:ABC transporter ATP-binding protein/permease [Vibrio kasasachensis]|uniref:ABC transporter ATP-binding protein/permease n=1 Tax=Vibrio kasasachensis TaxID=2910248 RepID=UPI003D0B0378